MNQVMKLWQFLNGKKTAIGGILLFMSAFLTQVVMGIWAVDALWVDRLAQTCDWGGMLVLGTGLAHKGVKNLPG